MESFNFLENSRKGTGYAVTSYAVDKAGTTASPSPSFSDVLGKEFELHTNEKPPALRDKVWLILAAPGR